MQAQVRVGHHHRHAGAGGVIDDVIAVAVDRQEQVWV